MKKIFKEMIKPVLLAILCGFILGRHYFKIYHDYLHSELISEKLYLIQNGEYNSVMEMRNDNEDKNYLYYVDNDKYKSIVGITSEYDNALKIKSLYDGCVVREYYMPYDNIDNKQVEYDQELEDTNDINEIKIIARDILELYKVNIY